MDTEFNECPYCGADIEINHDDGYGYTEGETFNDYCSKCDKGFSYSTCISFDYTTWKAPCLNGGEHDFSPTTTIPKYFTKMVCDCGEEREPTDEERKEHNIPTREEYLKERKEASNERD